MFRAAVRLEIFTRDELMRETDRRASPVQRIMADWHNKGLIIVAEKRRRQQWSYAVNPEMVGLVSQIDAQNHRTPVANMWGCIRVLRQFSARDVAMHGTTSKVQVSEKQAKIYLARLAEAGVLRLAAGINQKGGEPIYCLAKKVGVKPMLVRKIEVLYDPNKEEITPLDGGANG